MVEVKDIQKERTDEEGWERRSILDEPRLSEAVHMYEEMGYEVLVKEVRAEDVKDGSCCTECIPDTMKVIYTRKGSDGGRSGEEQDADDGNDTSGSDLWGEKRGGV